ncbi:MAG: HD domain-containing protein [Acidobacteria bacterium]|nr:HD domain-containing protein [Acidobacteriota bacterium]
MSVFRRFRSSLSYPIIATLVLVTVVPLVAVGLLLAARNREHLTTIEKQYLTRQAVSLASEVSLFYTVHSTRLSSTVRALEAAGSFSPQDLESLLATLAQHDPAILRLEILDQSGKGAFVRTRNLRPSAEQRLTALFAQDRKAAFAGKVTQRLHVPLPGLTAGVATFAYPLTSSGGTKPRAVLCGAVDLNGLQERLHDNALAGLNIAIIDHKGRVVLASRPGLAGRSMAGSPLVHDFLIKPLRLTRVYRTRAGDGAQQMLGSIAPVGQPRWGVIVERPTAKAFAFVRAMQIRTLIVTGIAAGGALALGYFLSGFMIRPLQRLAGVTSELAGGNLTVRANVAGYNELAHLATNFNNMAGNIESLVRRLKQALRQNQELFLETIRTLAAAIDAKDPYTRGHAERVSSFSMAIARHLGLSQEQVFRIRIAAILHDVGKLGIRDDILKKPGRLTAEEFAVMRQHPVIGAQIMAPIRMLRDIIPGIRNHHEMWDGSGYPDHLTGETIPLVARIIGVADTFDAMTTDRPYQRALRLEVVLDRMRAMAGIRFDPKVIEALAAAVAAGDITPPPRTTPPLIDPRDPESNQEAS